MQGNLHEVLPQPEYCCAYDTEYSQALCPHALVFSLQARGSHDRMGT